MHSNTTLVKVKSRDVAIMFYIAKFKYNTC